MKAFKRNGHYQLLLWEKEVITRSGDEKKLPYLARLTLIRTPWFQVLFHKFLISDDDCLHDHPWPFLSLILWGGYWEWCRYEDIPLRQQEKLNFQYLERRLALNGELQVKRRYNPGSLLYRPAEWRHRVEIDKPAYSMVITFKKSRTWGFWTKAGFVHYKDYSSQARCE